MPPKPEAMNRLERVLAELSQVEDLHYEAPEFLKWRLTARRAITYSFGTHSRHIDEFERIRFDPAYISTFDERQNKIIADKSFRTGLDEAKVRLEDMLEEIDEDWGDDPSSEPASPAQEMPEQQVSDQVFIVHGRDDGPKDTVARYLSSLELDPVILHEQPNEGRTIVEKFEDYADVGFAIVLCTPDDIGALSSDQENLRPRPRQNVVLELGFFLGRMGRKRVCALLEGNLEMPSDYDGVLFIPLDAAGGWKLILARELKAAGLTIDMNRIV